MSHLVGSCPSRVYWLSAEQRLGGFSNSWHTIGTSIGSLLMLAITSSTWLITNALDRSLMLLTDHSCSWQIPNALDRSLMHREITNALDRSLMLLRLIKKSALFSWTVIILVYLFENSNKHSGAHTIDALHSMIIYPLHCNWKNRWAWFNHFLGAVKLLLCKHFTKRIITKLSGKCR